MALRHSALHSTSASCARACERQKSLPAWLGGAGFAIGEHPFGQDEIGRDNFALVMKGVQTSLLVMIVMSLYLVRWARKHGWW